jgi:hypothetical protein
MYEGQVQGTIHLQLRYLPIPPVAAERKRYQVKGGMPGIDWGALNLRYNGDSQTPLDDLEHCFFINHDKTGATCAVYRSLEHKTVVVSFRGTCAPIDLLTDASIVQDAWVEGEDVTDQLTAKVHAGFRSSLNSISRRLKELLLAAVAPGEELADYHLLVTGHSLGGALATLFVADVAQYGLDAGRALPQLEPSEPWWKGVASTIMGKEAQSAQSSAPPRPKSLRLYSFGSPRVGNHAFAELFDALLGEKYIDQAYRIVNGDDIVARLPRTINAFVFGNVGYEHCGPTVLITQPENGTQTHVQSRLWIEGESEGQCPVRDGVAFSEEGSLLAELFNATTEDGINQTTTASGLSLSKLSAAATKLTKRVQAGLTVSDVASVLGLDRSFTEREFKLISSLFEGRGLSHHLEDEYYKGMGLAAGFLALLGEDIVDLPTSTE